MFEDPEAVNAMVRVYWIWQTVRRAVKLMRKDGGCSRADRL